MTYGQIAAFVTVHHDLPRKDAGGAADVIRARDQIAGAVPVVRPV